MLSIVDLKFTSYLSSHGMMLKSSVSYYVIAPTSLDQLLGLRVDLLRWTVHRRKWTMQQNCELCRLFRWIWL